MKQAVRAIVVNGDDLLVMHRNKAGNQYYTLIGGGVEAGEDLEEALLREVSEETGLQVGTPRLVYIEEAGDEHGTQYIYICDYLGGEAALAADSEEAALNRLGFNTYSPEWLPISRLADAPFVSPGLKRRLLETLPTGPWPAPPERFSHELQTV